MVTYYRKFLKTIQRDFYKDKVYLAMLLELLTKLSEFNYVDEIAEEIVKSSYLHVSLCFISSFNPRLYLFRSTTMPFQLESGTSSFSFARNPRNSTRKSSSS